MIADQYGAKTVHGFDIQEEIVKLAKQITSHLDMIHIQVGDAANIPYDDASFDVALSLYSCGVAIIIVLFVKGVYPSRISVAQVLTL